MLRQLAECVAILLALGFVWGGLCTLISRVEKWWRFWPADPQA